MTANIASCSRCGAPITNPQAQNCNRCGIAFLTVLPKNTLVGGQYRVIQSIKEGGAGQIYVAEDTRTFDRQCVLKRTILSNDATARQQFASEAHMLTKLRHPQIPQVFAYFEEHGSTYIVMEYITGSDLESGLTQTLDDGSLLVGKPRELRQTLHDGIVVCSLLEYLHSRTPAIIHCDIKPANLIRDHDSNMLFLVDFGAAAATNGVFGTPGYAAPEQYQQQRLSASDIYALAATLYHLLTDDDPTEHPRQFPKLGQLPKTVQQTLGRALSNNAGDRPSAKAFKELLEECLASPGIDPTVLAFPSGVTPTSLVELAREMYQDWDAAHTFVQNGEMATWLHQHKYESFALWHEQIVATQGANYAVDLLLWRIMPSLDTPKVLFNHSQLDIPADDQIITTLKVQVLGGAAKLAVRSAPAWLHIGPHSVTVLPNQPAIFNIAILRDYLPRINRREKIIFKTSYVGRPEQDTYELEATLVALSGGQPYAPATQKSTNITSLLIGWTVCALLLLMCLVLFPYNSFLPVPMCLGMAIGVTANWIYGEDLTDSIIMIGGAAGAGIAGRILYAWITSSVTANPLNPVILLMVIGSAVSALSLYQAFKP